LTEISGGAEIGELRYSGSEAADASAADTELRRQLDLVRDQELARGVTLAGPHRDDVEIILNTRAAKSTASQGQQRSLVLAMVLAEVLRLRELSGVAPIVLLDDVLSELDHERRGHLLSTLSTAGAGQVFVTTCESPHEAGFSTGHRLTVENGRVRSGEPVA
jgi:DNA replication and repair protein RecF